MISSTQNQVCVSPIYLRRTILFLETLLGRLIDYLSQTNWKVISENLIFQNFGHHLKILKANIEKVWQISLVNGLEILELDKNNLTNHHLIPHFQCGKSCEDDVDLIRKECDFIKGNCTQTEAGIFKQFIPKDSWILGAAFIEKFWRVKKLTEGFFGQPIVTGE